MSRSPGRNLRSEPFSLEIRLIRARTITYNELWSRARLHKHLNISRRWARIVLEALSVAGLIGLLAASGCINGESVDSPSQDSATGATTSHIRKIANQNLKPAIPVAGDVLIAGGADASNQSIADAEFFDPSLGQFVATGIAASSRAGISAAPLSPTQVLFAGGFSGRATIKNFSLNLEGRGAGAAPNRSTRPPAHSHPPARWARRAWAYTATELNNGKVLVAGGLDNQDNVLDTAEAVRSRRAQVLAGRQHDERSAHVSHCDAAAERQSAPGRRRDQSHPATPPTPPTSTIPRRTRLRPRPSRWTISAPRIPRRCSPAGPLAGKVLITGGVGGSSFFFKDSSAETLRSRLAGIHPALELHERAALDALPRRLLDDGDGPARRRLQRHGRSFGRGAIGRVGT